MQVFKALRNKKQKTEIPRKLKNRELIEAEKDFLWNSCTAIPKQAIQIGFQHFGLKNVDIAAKMINLKYTWITKLLRSKLP